MAAEGGAEGPQVSADRSAGAGRDGSRLRQERYRFEPQAMRIVQAVKDHLLPAMSEEQGGWLLGQILDLAALVRLAVPDPLASDTGQGELRQVLVAMLGEAEKRWCDMEACGCTTSTLIRRAHAALDASSVPVRASAEPQKPTRQSVELPSDVTIKMLETTIACLERRLDECQPFLKDGETPAQCIARNRADVDVALGLLAKEKQKASASPSDDGARQPQLRALIDALAVLEGRCGADDRTAAYAVAGAARAYVDSRAAASDDGARLFHQIACPTLTKAGPCNCTPIRITEKEK